MWLLPGATRMRNVPSAWIGATAQPAPLRGRDGP
jgi:hypothetical protein